MTPGEMCTRSLKCYGNLRKTYEQFRRFPKIDLIKGDLVVTSIRTHFMMKLPATVASKSEIEEARVSLLEASAFNWNYGVMNFLAATLATYGLFANNAKSNPRMPDSAYTCFIT